MAWPATSSLIAHVRHPRCRDDRQGHRLPVDVEVRVPGRGRARSPAASTASQRPACARTRRARSARADPTRTTCSTSTTQLVLPVDTKIRFVITADDVIHAWWVPALGWKQDAIPGIVNEAWTDIEEPGIYRGQCAELCGKDHGFMPIVVRRCRKDEFEQWLAAEEGRRAPAPAPRQPPRLRRRATQRRRAADAAPAPPTTAPIAQQADRRPHRASARQATTHPDSPRRTTTTTATSRASSNAGSSRPTTRTSARCTWSSASSCSSSARRMCGVIRLELIEPGPAVRAARVLQPDDHHARAGDDLRRRDAGLRRPGQLDDPAADRRAGHGAAAHEQLVVLDPAVRLHACCC